MTYLIPEKDYKKAMFQLRGVFNGAFRPIIGEAGEPTVNYGLKEIVLQGIEVAVKG